MFPRLNSVVACIGISFLFMVEYYSTVCIDHIMFIHSSVNGHLAFFHLLDILNNTSINTSIQVSV